MIKQNIPIFFSIDDNYSKLLQIALQSITQNSSTYNQYDIYILHSGLSQESVNDILNFERDNFKISFVDMTKELEEISHKLFTRDYYSKTTYYRLFIPRLFPEIDKALYLDSDIVVLDDIANLYNYELGTNLVGAIPDEAVQIVPEFITYVDKYLGFPHEQYFNAGVLLMNLDELRKFNFEDKFVSLISQIKFSVAQDQDYLNVICNGRVTYIPSVWDKMPFPSETIKPEDIKLVHYNLSFKPWHYDGILYEEYFYRYAEELEMLDYINKCKNEFTDEKKKIDLLGGENLKKLAFELTEIEDTFINLLKAGKIKF